MPNRIGQKLGNYQLLRLLGQGGFAEVYLGRHLHLKTLAAIKVLQVHMQSEETRNFKREAQIIAALKHPHIVHILDFDIEQHTPYLVMDFASNGSLRQAQPKGSRLPLETCIGYTQQIASALQYAHDNRVIHRDVKPENMLIGNNHGLLLTDFGIAVFSQSSRYQGQQEIGGTVAYMAPEQLMGNAVAASDQYALGIVVYEWLSGAVPFTGSFTEICSQHVLASPPSLRAQIPTLPQSIEKAILRSLAKDPEQRYPSVVSFAEALQQAYDEPIQTSSFWAAPILQTTPSTRVKNIPSFTPTVPARIEANKSTVYPSGNSFLRYPSTQPAIQEQLFQPSGKHKRNKGYGIVITILLCIIVAMASGGAYLFNKQGFDTHTQNVSLSQQGTTGTSITPTLTPTPKNKVITENLKMTCLSFCMYAPAVTLNKIEIDPPDNRMIWYFTITNDGKGFCRPQTTISLVDPLGSRIDPSGGTISDIETPLDDGQSLPRTAIFELAPQAGSTYLLHAIISCIILIDENMKVESFTF